MSSNVADHPYKDRLERLGRQVDKGGEPPDNSDMESRVAKLEALMPTLATREDVLRLEVKLHQEINAQTWKFVTWMTGICTALIGATYFIITHAK